ncbi:MAG: PKD domain-containing protein [Candidatus Bathyarchaeota archaeon]|nr:PKD domain-containing protein [Candidatus Bathyarchaeota archaeon]
MSKTVSLLAVLVISILALSIAGIQAVKAQTSQGSQLTVTISPSGSTTMDMGQRIQFVAFASGGTPPYSYQWHSNGDIIPNATSSSFTFEPNYPDTYEISVTVNDTLDAQATSNKTSVIVNSWLSLNIEQGSAKTQVGKPVQFTAQVTGGTPPYTFQWYYRLSPSGEKMAGATSSIFVFTPTEEGTYIIDLVVKDALNVQTDSGPLPLSVTLPSEPTSTSSTLPTPTLTPTQTAPSSPTPTSVSNRSNAYPASTIIIVVSVTAIAAMVLLIEQRHRQTEKPKSSFSAV